MSAEQLVAAAAAATGPITDGDLAGWAERVRQAASSAVVIAADMDKLLDALTDKECRKFVRVVTDVTRDKGRFLIHYDPPTEYTFKGQTTSHDTIRTGWDDEPAVIHLARTARACVGQRAVFFQRNEKEEGDTEAPAAGYRRVWHIEPVPTGERRARPEPPAASAPPTNGNGHHAEPEPEPESAPAGDSGGSRPEPSTAEPAPQPTLSDAEPPPPMIDPRPMDPAFLADVVGLMDRADLDDDSAELRPEVADAFRNEWWNKLGAPGQAQLRKANADAKRRGDPHVASIHNPTTVGQLKTIGRLTRCFADADAAVAS